MKMPYKFYQRGICVWLTAGLLLLAGWLIYQVLTVPFQMMFIFIGWLIAGAFLVSWYAIVDLWDTDFGMF